MLTAEMNVLVIDDSRWMSKVVEKHLSTWGRVKCYKIHDGEAAWQFLRAGAKTIDLVISNWNMPGCSGIELLRRIRESSLPFKQVPFVMLTAECEKKFFAEVDEYTETGFLNKPFRKKELYNQIDKFKPVQ